MTMLNQYPGRCAVCKTPVDTNAGWYDRLLGGCLCTAHKDGMPTPTGLKTDADLDGPDPFGQRAAPKEVEKLEPLKDYMAEARAVQADLEQAMRDQHDALVTAMAERWELSVPTMVAELLASARPIEIKVGAAPPVKIKQHHKALPDVLTLVTAGVSPFLVGPAGSGKTTLAEQVAKTMGLPFMMAARVTSEFKLVGFKTATGDTVRTQFREAYEHGGVFLFDEVDASDPDALTAFNAALANGLCDFPDGMVKRHKDFHAIAAGNTYGRGADRQYVGRNQLDAATLDRFAVIDIDYDQDLERALAGDAKWTAHVQRVRWAVEREKVRHVVSPRASITGARLLAAGMAWAKVDNMTVWKGLDAATRQRVETAMAGAPIMVGE